jgi:hypothetical protein
MSKIIKLPPPVRGAVTPRQPGEPASRDCGGCKRTLTICSFSLKTREPLRRQSQCRECAAKANRASYERNSAKVKARSKQARGGVLARNRLWLAERLAGEACACCGLAAPQILEFDHRHGAKSASVSQMVQRGLSIKTIEAEIAKCDILCPNCHRIRTHADTDSYLHRYVFGLPLESPALSPLMDNDRERRKRRRARLRNRLDNIAYLAAHPCVDCGEDDLRVLEYDHVRGEKRDDVGRLISTGAGVERIEAERAKCDVRCANCHREKSANVRPLAAACA